MDSATCVYFLELVLLDLIQTLDQQAGVRGNTGINEIFFDKVFIYHHFSAGLCSAEKYVRKMEIIGKLFSKFSFYIAQSFNLQSRIHNIYTL